MNQISLPYGSTDIEALELIVEGIKRLTGAEIVITDTVIISTDDATAYQVLTDLLTAKSIAPIPEPKKEKKTSGKPRGKYKNHVAAWSVEKTGEHLTGQAVRQRLVHHEFELGEALHHPKHGVLFVFPGKTEGAQFVLRDAAQEVKA